MQECTTVVTCRCIFPTHWDATKKCTWMMWMLIGNPERVESTNVQRIIVQVGQPSVPAPGETRGLQCRMAHTRGAVDALFWCC